MCSDTHRQRLNGTRNERLAVRAVNLVGVYLICVGFSTLHSSSFPNESSGKTRATNSGSPHPDSAFFTLQGNWFLVHGSFFTDYEVLIIFHNPTSLKKTLTKYPPGNSSCCVEHMYLQRVTDALSIPCLSNARGQLPLRQFSRTHVTVVSPSGSTPLTGNVPHT